MKRWPATLFRSSASHLSSESQNAALAAAHRSQDRGLPAILTLKHLSLHAGVEYRYLREVVERARDPYRSFQIRKRLGGFRTIVVPEKELMQTQRWISRFVLRNLTVHPLSFAYCCGRSAIDCASVHLGAKWLIKVDVRQFFESISELQVYRIFSQAGYGKLISFELARICTRTIAEGSQKRRQKQWRNLNPESYSINYYRSSFLGHLAQGAPTSPMLSNLAMINFDREIEAIAKSYGLSYSRYSDDLVFSTLDQFSRENSCELIDSIYRQMNSLGLRPHQSKTVISPPGSRKVVLGLLVDGAKLRLTREYRRMIECHAHFIATVGPINHARARGFDSVLGLRRFFEGTLNYANKVDPEFAKKIAAMVQKVDWPA